MDIWTGHLDRTCLEQCPGHVQDIEIFLGHCPVPALGGITFNHLIFTSHDFINGELVCRATAPLPTSRQYFLNTQTNRLIQADSRRYHEMIRTGWNIIEDYYLIPLGEPVAETIVMVQNLGNEIVRKQRNVDVN